MATLSRRRFIKRMLGTAAASLTAAVTGGCRMQETQEPPPDPQPAPTSTLPTAATPLVAEIPRIIEPTPSPRSPARTTPFTMPSPGTATATPAPVPPVTLRADVLNYGWTRLAQQMTETFQDAHPQITLQWRSVSDWRDYPDRVAILRASGQLGDLIESPCATLTAAWALDGLAADLTPLIEADGYDTSGLFAGAMAAFARDGRQVGLPLVAHGSEHLLLYDEELLAGAGVSTPGEIATLDDLANIAQAVGHRGHGLWGHVIPTRLPDAFPLLRAFGADLFDGTGARCTLDAPEGRAFLAWLHHQIVQARAAPSAREIERGPTAMWQAGRVAMLHTNLRHAVALQDMQPERQIGVLPLPPMPESARAPAVMAGVGYCIPATSRQAVAALQWIKFLLRDEVGVRLFAEGHAEPGSRISCWSDPQVQSRFAASAPIAEVLRHAAPERIPANLATERCYRVWNAHVPRMLDGALSPDEAASRIAVAIREIIGEEPPTD